MRVVPVPLACLDCVMMNPAHGKPSRYRVESDVDLVDEVGGLGYAHEGAARVDILHPAIHLFIGPEGKVNQLLLGFQLYAEWLEVDTLDIDHFG
jgi:hypothetical protein